MVEIAIMGFGVVGSGVGEVLREHAESIARRAKEEIHIKYILDLRDFPDSPFAGRAECYPMGQFEIEDCREDGV